MNDVTIRLGRFIAACLSIALASCGGGGGGDGTDSESRSTAIVAALGGTVIAGDATLVIPAGALRQDTTISVSISGPNPSLPQSATLGGKVYDFGPNGTTFSTPATLTLPLVGTPAANERAVISYFDPVSQQWVDLPSTVTNGSISAPLTHFTEFAQRFTGLDPGLPEREWSFSAKLGDGSSRFLSGSKQILGTLNATIDYGSAFNDQPIVIGNGLSGLRPSDEIATGQIFSSESGGTFFVSGEAPSRINLVADSPIGNHALLTQLQSFVRDSANASLTFDITDLVLEATDLNDPTNLSFAECPTTPCPDLIVASVAMRVEARTDRMGIIYDATGIAQVRGDSRGWTHSTDRGQFFCPDNPNACRSPFFGTIQLWGDLSVQRTSDAEGTFIRLKLREALPFSIDLTNVDVNETVTLEIIATATTVDRRAGSDRRSSAYAYLRDPRTIGGLGLATTGLRATSQHVPALPVVNLLPPAPCVAEAEPAGTLQFSAASYTLPEWAGGEQAAIQVTRTGGSRGAVSATFSTHDATAIAGADYTPVRMTVAFADGDATPKILTVPIVHDGVAEADKALELTLSEPGGCAILGTSPSALLLILDDDRAPAPSFTIGGTVGGLVGTGLVLQNLGSQLSPANGPFTFGSPLRSGSSYAVTVASQPTDPVQVCSVANGSGTVGSANVNNVAVDCAATQPNSVLDASFGGTGKVTTPSTGIGNAVALQPDGKIVTVGGPFTLTRHNADGGPDTGFGALGKVTTAFGAGSGTAHDVAIQSDGRIVVVGSTRARAGFASDDNFTLRRYDSAGNLDASFGIGGVVVTDFAALADVAKAVAIQPDGKIVVAGRSQNASGIDFAVARYNADGSADPTFGSAGKLTTDVAGGPEGLPSIALQSDGKIVVAGRFGIGNSTGGTALVRYNGDGSLDLGLGDRGKVSVASGVTADAVALQPDGKILVAGSVNAGASSSAFGVTRFLANGSPDAAFGTVTTSFFTGGNGSIGRNVALQADGKIVLVGEAASDDSSTFEMAIARFDASGALDTGFGTGGKLLVDFFAGTDAALDVVIQPDGKIVVAGSARNGSLSEFALARINR